MTSVSTPLGEIADLIRGITFPASAKHSSSADGLIPCLRTSNVQRTVTWDDLLYVPDGYLRSEAQEVRRGDIVISMSNSLELVGKCAIVSDVPTRATFGGFIAVLRPRPGIDPLYVFHAMRTGRFRSHIKSVASTTTNISNINSNKLLAAQIPVVAQRSQERITSKIDELFSRIDEGEQALKRVENLVERYRQSVLKAAVTGDLTRDWRAARKRAGESVESGTALLARILKARRAAWEAAELAKLKARGKLPTDDRWKQRYQEPAAPDTTDLPPLPEGWVWASMDQLTIKITSGSRDWRAYYGRGVGVFVMAQNVRPSRFDMTDVQRVDPPDGDRDAERSEIAKDDLLITIVGANTGDVCRVDRPVSRHYVCQSVALMRPTDVGLSEYIVVYLNIADAGRAELDKEIYGAGRPHLSFDQLRTIRVPIPPIAERAAILDSLSDYESQLSSVRDNVTALTKTTTALRQSILKAAFSGQLVPQDPNDEPASKLLERIAIERAAEPALRQRKKKSA